MFLLLLIAVATATWELEMIQMDTLKGPPRYRIDMLKGPGDQGEVKQAIACYGMHPLSVGSTCESPGLVRRRLASGEQTFTASPLEGFFGMVDVVMDNGERCLREIPAIVSEADAVKNKMPTTNMGDTIPWYYYSIVIVAACVIGAVILVVVAGIYRGKDHSYSALFVNAYQSVGDKKTKAMTAEALGLFQPSMTLVDED
jgi:hypothetical protein